MATLSEDAVRLDGTSLNDPEAIERPVAYFRALREREPIFYDEKLDMYLVSRYEDLAEVLRDPITYSQELGWLRSFAHGFFDEFKAILERDGGGYFPDVILADPPKHTRIRRLLEGAFTARRVKTLEGRMEKLAAELVGRIAANGEGDGVQDIAQPMTIHFMCEQLGFEHADADKVKEWSRAYTAQVSRMQNHDDMVANAALICELQHYVIARIAEREVEPREDMVSDLVQARLDDDEQPTLSFAEKVALTRTLLVGGNDTTATSISNALHTIATQPELQEALAANIEDDRYLGRFLEENLRLYPPVRNLARVTTKDVVLGGTPIPANSHLAVIFASGNDDESVFEDARSFDMERKNIARHLSFGQGTHLCIGMALARMEARVAIREVLRQLKDIRMAVGPEGIRYQASKNRVRENLPLKFSQRV